MDSIKEFLNSREKVPGKMYTIEVAVDDPVEFMEDWGVAYEQLAKEWGPPKFFVTSFWDIFMVKVEIVYCCEGDSQNTNESLEQMKLK
jgi:hypothetical protein